MNAEVGSWDVRQHRVAEVLKAIDQGKEKRVAKAGKKSLMQMILT